MLNPRHHQLIKTIEELEEVAKLIKALESKLQIWVMAAGLSIILVQKFKQGNIDRQKLL